MLVIQGQNVNDVYHEAMWKAPVYAIKRTTRNGEALVFPTPVCSVYERPWERMLYNADRDANPFFHIMEGLWMLSGENRHALISNYAANIANFSDDGVTLNGAYGHRWRNYFDFDQLEWVVNHLKSHPNSRRAVLGMWDPMEDPKSVDNGSLDVPCNTHVYFQVTEGKLDMTVCCRSNDMVWGAYGANAVHMSMLQDFVAGSLGVGMGRYYQFSNNLHIYEKHWKLLRPQLEPYYIFSDYLPLVPDKKWEQFLEDCSYFFAGKSEGLASHFIQNVAVPMRDIWGVHKLKETAYASTMTKLIADQSIALACRKWLNRRIK